MTCLLAILMTSVARMVIIGTHSFQDYYGVFTTTKINKFPVPHDSHQIHMSASKISGPGTYVVAYCSITLRYDKILGIITRGQSEVTHSPGETSLRYLEAEKACIQSIIGESSHGAAAAASLSKLNNGVCTHQLIASLAFKGVIGVEGEFSCIAPSQEDQPIKVKADIPIDMHQFLSGGVFLGGKDIESNKQVLVWFQGNLHLFRQSKTINNGCHSWSPITSIGKEMDNGGPIANFIDYSLPIIRQFVYVMEDFDTLVMTMRMYHQPWYWKLSKSNFKKGNYRDIYESLEDVCMLARGFKEDRCGWLTNVPVYLLKDARDIGLLCQTKVKDWIGLIRESVCIFRPAIARNVWFRSNQWRYHEWWFKVFKIPPQFNSSENAARLTERDGRGTLCETNSW